MRFAGSLAKDGKHWLAEVPMFDALTQGRTRKEALDMVADWFVTMADQRGFSVDVYGGKTNRFEVGSADTRTMVRLLLRRQRQRNGMTLAEATRKLNANYARYERGDATPSLEKLDELLRTLSPSMDFVMEPIGAT